MDETGYFNTWSVARYFDVLNDDIYSSKATRDQ